MEEKTIPARSQPDFVILIHHFIWIGDLDFKKRISFFLDTYYFWNFNWYLNNWKIKVIINFSTNS